MDLLFSLMFRENTSQSIIQRLFEGSVKRKWQSFSANAKKLSQMFYSVLNKPQSLQLV